MDSHSFCRMLLSTAIADLKEKDPSFKSSSLSTTKSSIGGYEIQGPNRFYYYTSSACCIWSAKAEAIDSLLERITEDDELEYERIFSL